MNETDKIEIAKKILGCAEVKKLPQKGNRNIGIYVSVGEHKFSGRFKRATCKFYKGDGSTKGFAEGYMPYHNKYFPQIPALHSRLVQQSLGSGIYADGKNRVPYSVFEYIEGRMLRDVVGNKDFPVPLPSISVRQARKIIWDMFMDVWIMIWAAGLRFRDGHTGNWVYGDDGNTYMIDTEQIRRDAAELCSTPNDWTQRNKHEKSCLRLVDGIFADLANACGIKITDARAKELIAKTNLKEALGNLGRDPSMGAEAVAAAKCAVLDAVDLFFPSGMGWGM